jgi:N,N-dimethylformamidase
MIEIRRSFTGTRTWEGEAGENCMSFTGEPSGLWRSNGRPPNRLVGVGFDAQVFDRCWPYERTEEGRDPRVAFVFDGVGENELIGDFGLRLNGAAGLEVDRVDPTLGSPPSTITLASGWCQSPGSLPTSEDFYITHRGLTGDQTTGFAPILPSSRPPKAAPSSRPARLPGAVHCLTRDISTT